MKIVQINEIPSVTNNTPLNNLSELYATAQEMENLCKSNNGVGISAVQVGLPWKFFIYCDDQNIFHYMIDCEYSPKTQNKFVSVEGCLSIRNLDNSIRHFKVMRYDSINVKGYELLAKDKLEVVEFEKTLEKSLECAIFQHEIDHHNNLLISSMGEEIFIQEVVKK